MDHTSFRPFHNRYIEFDYLTDDGFYKKFTGVILDLLNYDEKSTPTEYIFIAGQDLTEWKEADKMNDEARKDELQMKVDIRNVRNPNILQFT